MEGTLAWLVHRRGEKNHRYEVLCPRHIGIKVHYIITTAFKLKPAWCQSSGSATTEHCCHVNESSDVGWMLDGLSGHQEFPLEIDAFSAYFIWQMWRSNESWTWKRLVNSEGIYKCKRLFLLSPNTAVSTHGDRPPLTHLSALVTLAILGNLFVLKDSGGGEEGESENNTNVFIKYFTSPRWKFLDKYHIT